MCIFLDPGPASHPYREWIPYPTCVPESDPALPHRLPLKEPLSRPHVSRTERRSIFGLSPLEQMNDFQPALAADFLWSWAKET